MLEDLLREGRRRGVESVFAVASFIEIRARHHWIYANLLMGQDGEKSADFGFAETRNNYFYTTYLI